jgi:hypothetical protein
MQQPYHEKIGRLSKFWLMLKMAPSNNNGCNRHVKKGRLGAEVFKICGSKPANTPGDADSGRSLLFPQERGKNRCPELLKFFPQCLLSNWNFLLSQGLGKSSSKKTPRNNTKQYTPSGRYCMLVSFDAIMDNTEHVLSMCCSTFFFFFRGKKIHE